MPPKVLHPHQRAVVKFITQPENRSVAVFHGTGCGKTLTGIRSAVELLKQRPDTYVFIVASPAIQANFKRELAQEDIPLEQKRRFSFSTANHFLSVTSVKPYQNCILIVDEVHNLRTRIVRSRTNPNNITAGKIAYAVMRVSFVAWKVILMTASPIVNTSHDLVNILSMLHGQEIPIHQNITSAVDINPSSIKETKEFYKLLANKISYFRKPLHEENPDFPKYSVNTIRVIMTPEEVTKYEKFEGCMFDDIPSDERSRVGDFGNWFMCFMNGMRRVGDSAMSNRVATPDEQNEEMAQALAAPKLRYAVNYIVANPHARVLIFSTWIRAAISVAERMLTELGVSFGTITGEVQSNLRDVMVQDFNSGKRRVLLFTRAGGEGLDLKGVDKVYILEPGWNNMIEQQAMDRAIRFRSHDHLPESMRMVHVERLQISFNDDLRKKPLYPGMKERITVDERLDMDYVLRKQGISDGLCSIFDDLSLS